MQATETSTQLRNPLRSTGAVLAGFFAVVVLSLATDQVLHVLNVYPPWGQPMHEPGLNLLALSYRIVYTVLGSYIAARLAPRNRMRHALVLGVVGFVVGSAGALATIPMKLGAGLVSHCNRAHCVALCLAGRQAGGDAVGHAQRRLSRDALFGGRILCRRLLKLTALSRIRTEAKGSPAVRLKV